MRSNRMTPTTERMRNPRSLANLVRGAHVKDPAKRRAIARKAGLARAQQFAFRLPETIATMTPEQAYRFGWRRGSNIAYHRWRKYADRVIQQAFRPTTEPRS